MKEFKKPELLAPAGNTEAFFAALDSGADAVYAGLKSFSARGRARNFSISDLEKMVPYAQALGKRVYIALNTILKESERLDIDLIVLGCQRHSLLYGALMDVTEEGLLSKCAYPIMFVPMEV